MMTAVVTGCTRRNGAGFSVAPANSGWSVTAASASHAERAVNWPHEPSRSGNLT